MLLSGFHQGRNASHRVRRPAGVGPSGTETLECLLDTPMCVLPPGLLDGLFEGGGGRADGARFVLASTSEVYGDPLEHPQAGTSWGNVNPVGPRSVYDESKRFAETLVTAHRQVHGTDTAIVTRRTAYLDAGGFHPLLFFGAGETLLAYDLAARGWGVTHCPEVVAHHHPAPGPRADHPAVVRRNGLLTAWLRRPLPYALAGTRDLAATARRGSSARRALREALVRLPAAPRARHPLPSQVERAARVLDRTTGGPAWPTTAPPS